MMIPYSEIKKIYKDANYWIDDYSERNLARDIIRSLQKDDEIARLRAELLKYKQYTLELDRELQTGESHVEIQG